MTLRRIATRGGLLLAATALLLVPASGCARFDDSASTPFTPEMTFDPEAQNPTPTPPSSTSKTPRPPGPCVDQDESVIATCLDSTGGLVVLPDGGSALVAERKTGRILKVGVDQDQKAIEVARIDVDGSSDGGLIDLTISPSYDEDRTIYALITTGSDNRVVRIVPGDVPKDVLTGIPKGSTGNTGALDFTGRDELVVQTGDAGDPAAAQDPGSLAGKLLRVDTAVGGGPKPPPAVLLSGLGTGGDLCPGPNHEVWVSDRTAVEDRLQRVPVAGGPATTMWTWPDRPGVGGCAVGQDFALVMLAVPKAVAMLKVENGAVTAAPSLMAQDRYGSLGGAGVSPDGFVWAATVNKLPGGQPGPNDERVVRFPLQVGGGGGPD